MTNNIFCPCLSKMLDDSRYRSWSTPTVTLQKWCCATKWLRYLRSSAQVIPYTKWQRNSFVRFLGPGCWIVPRLWLLIKSMMICGTCRTECFLCWSVSSTSCFNTVLQCLQLQARMEASALNLIRRNRGSSLLLFFISFSQSYLHSHKSSLLYQPKQCLKISALLCRWRL